MFLDMKSNVMNSRYREKISSNIFICGFWEGTKFGNFDALEHPRSEFWNPPSGVFLQLYYCMFLDRSNVKVVTTHRTSSRVIYHARDTFSTSLYDNGCSWVVVIDTFLMTFFMRKMIKGKNTMFAVYFQIMQQKCTFSYCGLLLDKNFAWEDVVEAQ